MTKHKDSVEEREEVNTAEPNEAATNDVNQSTDETQSQANANSDAQSLEYKISELESQNEELQNRIVRLQADFENFKRRSRVEKEDILQFGTTRLLESLLPILDQLELALAVSRDATEQASIVKGVEMVAKQFSNVLEQEGLQPIQSIGEPFDPNLHEGVMQVEATEQFPAGTVAEELRKGYQLKGKVIRPAMVKVSQG